MSLFYGLGTVMNVNGILIFSINIKLFVLGEQVKITLKESGKH